eukprot:SAG31_NODE_575_length_13961_cov_41.577550_12_plen_249_part_00
MDQKRLAADALKQQGNECFKRGKLNAAIESYTQAIDSCPMATLYSNRAVCWFKLSKEAGRNEWEAVERDCRACIALEKSAKAFYYLGYALARMSRLEEAAAAFDEARRLSGGNDRSFNARLEAAVGGLKKEQWERREAARATRATTALYAAREALKQGAAVTQDPRSSEILNGVASTEVPVEVLNVEDHLQAIDGLLMDEQHKANNRDVPDWLCCRITFDLMVDPVITPDGHTYERATLVQHLQVRAP